MNGAYWIKPAGQTYAPQALVSWVTAVRRIPGSSRCDYHHQTAERICVAASRRRRGRWTDPFRAEFLEADAAHDWLEGWAGPSQRTYVVAPCASDALTFSDWWNRNTERGATWDGKGGGETDPPAPTTNDPAYRLRTLILRGNPDVIAYTTHGRGITWLSGKQYFDLAEHRLADAVSYVPVDRDPGKGARATRGFTLADRAGLWLHALQRLVDWWLLVAGGPFAFTAGGLALSFFRSRLAPKSVLAHSNPYVKRLEQTAIHGGRASVWFAGQVGRPDPEQARALRWPAAEPCRVIPGPVSLYDVRSMYPWLLGEHVYPTALQDVWENPTVEWVRDCLTESCVIARVDLDAREPEYPLKHRTGIIYPRGTFRTTLAGPELSRAIDRGEVLNVAVAVTYAPGRPFKRMTADLIRMRLEARAEKNAGWEHFIKLLSVSFSGKMAQKKGQWERRVHELAERDWGEWPRLNADTGAVTRFRAMAAMVQEYCPSDTAGRPMGAAYAYLTSYGRERMRVVRAGLPVASVVSQDTDGIWVLDDVLQQSGRTIPGTGESAGMLSRKRTSAFARFLSPKHYVDDTGWTLSGFCDPTVSTDGRSIYDEQTFNPILGSPIAPPAFTRVRSRHCPLPTLAAAGVVDSAGWYLPHQVRAGNLIAPPIPSDIASPASATPLFCPEHL